MSKKLKNEPISESDITEYLDSNNDFKLELETYKVCKEFGLNANHAGTYEDPVTNKPRQYDIRATFQKKSYFIKFSIECKNLKDSFPLIIHRTPSQEKEAYHEIVYSQKEEEIDNFRFPSLEDMANTIRLFNSLYIEGDFAGKSSSQLGRSIDNEFQSSDSEVYDKWTQAISSAWDLIDESKEDYRNTKSQFSFTAIIPILVISNNTLWVVDYDSDGNRLNKPYKTDFSSFYLAKDIWTGQYGVGYSISHLHIFTLEGLRTFFETLTKDNLEFLKFFPSDKIQEELLKLQKTL
ncbi:hypothetical protein [Leptospira perdikensis]|uniref:Uncharacterized protein n=1 Tax=Leptospira perdikensis TaxID=2484948 RepID=A0A4R9JA82_9LEPT|nr:hypothetical protein [Leptospira perdikensis]TGL36051.1 hypothetical protein EHQ49_16670 [Leptospira perdikensis]